MARIFWLLLIPVLSIPLNQNPHVEHVSIQSISQTLTDPDYLVMALIYDSDDQPSNLLCDTLQKIINKYYMYFKVKAFDCRAEDKCNQQLSKIIPNLQVLIPKGINPYTDQPLIYSQGYQGPIDYDKLLDFSVGNIPFLGEVLQQNNLDQFLSQTGKKVILFTNKDKVPLMFKGLTSFYRSRIEFGIVFNNQTALVNRFQISSFPKILVVDDQEKIEYQGKTQFEEIKNFLSAFALEEKKPLKGKKKIQSQPTNQPKLELPKFQIRNSDSSSLHSILNTQSKLALVHFYSDIQLPEWEDIVKNYNGPFLLINFKVSESDQDFIKELGAKRLPQARVFPINRKRKSFQLAFDSRAQLEQILTRELKSDITMLQDNLVQGFTLSVHQQRKVAVIFATDGSVPIQFKALAADPSFTDLTKFAIYNTSPQNFIKAFGGKRFPGIVTFMATDQLGNTKMLQYNGQLNNYSLMYYFLDQMAIPAFLQKQPEVSQDDLEEIMGMTFKNQEKVCTKKGGICIIGLFDGEPQGLESYELLKKIQAKSSKQNLPFYFTWVDGVCQYELREKFGISEVSLPNLAVYVPNKKLAARLIGRFMEDDVEKFIQSALRGRANVFDFGQFQVLDRDCESFRASIQRSTSDDLLGDMMEEEKKPKSKRKKRKKPKNDL